MNIKAWFKSKTADKVLSPARELIIDLIDKDSNVLEVGCGTGDLLFRASDKIKFGLGIDINQNMIDFANEKVKKYEYKNLEFISENITSYNNTKFKKFDVSTSTLCLHEMSEEEAISTLLLLKRYSTRIIIADYSITKTMWGKIFIEMDELISGHYSNFKNYMNSEGMLHLFKEVNLDVKSVIKTPIDGIEIWDLYV